jgi:hypothetical protein
VRIRRVRWHKRLRDKALLWLAGGRAVTINVSIHDDGEIVTISPYNGVFIRGPVPPKVLRLDIRNLTMMADPGQGST